MKLNGGIFIEAQHKGLICIVLSAMGFGIMPIFAKIAYKGGITPETLLSLRFILSGIILFIYLRLSKVSIKVTKRDLMYLFLLGGVLYSATAIFYFYSIRYISTALSVLIMYTHPMMVALLSNIFDRERLTVQVLMSMTVAFMGLSMILGDSLVLKVNTFGILLALATAISYSLYIFISSRIIKKVPSLVATAYISISAFGGLVGLGLAQGNLSLNFDTTVGIPLVGLVFCSTIFALVFFLKGVEVLGATKSTIISMFEPVFAVVFSMLIFKETLSFLQLVGGIAVLSGAVMVMIMKEKVTEVSGGQEV
ncbi:DMT family transporter [Alkaliphilus hydrothermalis]|uniref:Drug/metabolite transporter (DMT)-like permease n=1 Tax=Alkaliphilus hydrothermalis TaxID=1482730 RepID=A0ABS2NTV5_9FIRM|nr:DMT family transporter [Alkaliphilus hydrothermalis]MBM7616251.1 drug/metabolite transporter (DMT)-like permease [Alkaliphilus hydrothermalis]